MARFKAKPVEVEAVKFTGDNINEVWDTFGAGEIYGPILPESPYAKVWNKLEDQWINCPVGHWIIRGLKGELYPCEEEVLFMKYDRVDG